MRSRRRLNSLLALATAFIAFVPAGAQTPAKRAMGLEDILAFRAISLTSLAPNGQWYSYRLAPLQGDSEVILKSTSGATEMKFPVGEAGGGAAVFSADSQWAAITIAPTRRESQANTRARRSRHTGASPPIHRLRPQTPRAESSERSSSRRTRD